MSNTRDKETTPLEGSSALHEEIDKAMKSVTVTKFRTEQLHEKWREWLLAAGALYKYIQYYCIIDISYIVVL